MAKKDWINDYRRTTSDREWNRWHFLRDFLFQHRLRFVVYFRNGQKTRNRFKKFFYRAALYRLSRKFGLEIGFHTKIGEGLCLTHAYNITVSPYAVLGRNVNFNKGATIGIARGKKPGAPILGDNVFVGINSTVIGGISIGDDVLIAPNTLVNIDIPSHSIVIGNPCKVIAKENATSKYIAYPV